MGEREGQRVDGVVVVVVVVGWWEERLHVRQKTNKLPGVAYVSWATVAYSSPPVALSRAAVSASVCVSVCVDVCACATPT